MIRRRTCGAADGDGRAHAARCERRVEWSPMAFNPGTRLAYALNLHQR